MNCAKRSRTGNADLEKFVDEGRGNQERSWAAPYMAIQNGEGSKPLVELLTTRAFSALQDDTPRDFRKSLHVR
jgi:hypothetical protein